MKSSWFTQTEVFLLHEIVGRLDRFARKHVLEIKGISYGEFLVALAVREIAQPTHGEVGDFLDMSKSLVSQRVAGLLAKGFVVQRRDAQNRRQVRLALTAAGERALEKIYKELASNASNLFDVLGASRPQFVQSLHRLRDALVVAEAQDARNHAANKTRKRNRD
ncbi:MAG TPA: MarR family winged helix-turn-helix transcriptional regulator [Xanthobacteraceae bacterium]|nr:MarR family winged helix-turn-helix transcriptional regulator [Xanthobacteraceae bacterium]